MDVLCRFARTARNLDRVGVCVGCVERLLDIRRHISDELAVARNMPERVKTEHDHDLVLRIGQHELLAILGLQRHFGRRDTCRRSAHSIHELRKVLVHLACELGGWVWVCGFSRLDPPRKLRVEFFGLSKKFNTERRSRVRDLGDSRDSGNSGLVRGLARVHVKS